MCNIIHWVKYFTVIILFCTTVYFLLRKGLTSRISLILSITTVVLCFTLYAFDYHRAPRLKDSDMIEIQKNMENSDYAQLLNQVNISVSKQGHIDNSFGYSYRFNKTNTLQSRIQGHIKVYTDEKSAITSYESYKLLDNGDTFLSKFIFNTFESSDFQAFTTAFYRNYDYFFIPIDNYYSCYTTIRYKNSVINLYEVTDIPWKSKTKDVLLHKLDYNKFLFGNVGESYEDFKVF